MLRVRPRSNSSGEHALLVKGSKVVIIETENTLHRLPQYIGQIGIIKEAPVHPTTWFKVKFEDGVVCTFRPSALMHVSDDAQNTKTVGARDFRSGSEGGTSKRDESTRTHLHMGVAGGGVQAGNGMLLNELHGDLWVGAKVKATTGKMTGLEGIVLRSGNGWVQVELATYGEVAKRAHELEVVQYSGEVKRWPDRERLLQFALSPPSAERPAKRGRFDTDDDDIYLTSSRRAIRPRGLSDIGTESTSALLSGGVALTNTKSKHPVSDSDSKVKPTPLLIHPDIKEARFQYMQKYVKRVSEKVKDRPDLIYWTHILRANNVMTGGEPDEAVERQLARDFVDSVCSSCLVERWPFAKHCWNEACPESPVYWRLTGRSPKVVQPFQTDAKLHKNYFEQANQEAHADSIDVKAVTAAASVVSSVSLNKEVTSEPVTPSFDDTDRIMRARRRVSPPIESTVVDSESAQIGVFLQPQMGPGGSVPVRITGSKQSRRLYVDPREAEERTCGGNWAIPDEAELLQKLGEPFDGPAVPESSSAESSSVVSTPVATVPLVVSVPMVHTFKVTPPLRSIQISERGGSDDSRHLHVQSSFQLPSLIPPLPSVAPLLPAVPVNNPAATRFTFVPTSRGPEGLLLSSSPSAGAGRGAGSSSGGVSPYLAKGPEWLSTVVDSNLVIKEQLGSSFK